ncbi:hypothetical protein AC578_1332 [Pseudocercospora eumusae]|uniref:SSD domain-containing protein n=1 Tax=Pseudocercospora eumusae TaxID=321146 RepID=A0A139HUE1_9PEZI|nr:hypothetical protein AC578_1332 [Pseudocercospora eumusae]
MPCRISGAAVLMLWYLLSPIRGTTQPPRLSANHPIRKAFYRHGKTTATHWLLTMLLSVAIAMGFAYPSIALSDNPTAGIAAIPHTVWTIAKPIDDATAQVDIELRQIWIHGSFMKALDKDVLKRALIVQQSLVGDDGSSNTIPRLDDKLRSGTLQWGYHSPLMYWNNSREVIDADTDLLETINSQKRASSSLNVGMRPASVFAGKKFEGKKLISADALVITLMNKASDSIGDRWQSRMQDLSRVACDSCALFPSNGQITRQRVYEFSFTPLSMPEHIALTLAYSAMALYVIFSFRRMRAFHSRFGLICAAIFMMTCSIMASFTICGILKINLSTIPQNAYPFVALVLGVENMFRLINAVLAYPPTMATELRIANALGDVGPLSIAAAAQNLTILSILSMVVSPGVAAFCAFAAIASLFDAFYLLTFFVAVLNVDIRRLELQDALAARHNKPRSRRKALPAKHTWVDALIQGRLPFSTRMAGTAVTTTFILSLNYHFFEHRAGATNLRDLLGLVRGGPPAVDDFDSFTPPPMNATLTPAEWLRMQDFDTAKEVLRLAKPGADKFIMRLFAPLVVVLGGSDRAGVHSTREVWTQALRSFAVHHFYPVAVAIVFAVAFVAVLMNFLLYNEAGDEDNEMTLEDLEDNLATTSINLPHRLDIVKMASTDNGHFVTIGLDRTIAISVYDAISQTHHAVGVPQNILKAIAWPIHHIAIDDSGDWIACHCSDDRILAYNHVKGIAISRLVQYPDDHPATIFGFAMLPAATGPRPYFLVLTSGSRLAMSCLDDGLSSGADLSPFPLMGAALLDSVQAGKQIVIVTMEAKLISHTWSGDSWQRANATKIQLETDHGSLTEQVSLHRYWDLDTELLIVTTSSRALFLHSVTLGHIADFDLTSAGTPVESFLIGPSRKCPACSTLALRRAAGVGAAYKDSCSLTTWFVSQDSEACICLAQQSALCTSFSNASQDTIIIDSPGVWSPVKSEAIMGLRRRSAQHYDTPREKKRLTTAQLRQRRHAQQKTQVEPQWEAYKLSIDGDLQTLDLPSGEVDSLFVNHPGPIAALDGHSIAVALGNSIKVIRSSRRGGSASRRSRMNSIDRSGSVSKRSSGRKTR